MFAHEAGYMAMNYELEPLVLVSQVGLQNNLNETSRVWVGRSCNRRLN